MAKQTINTGNEPNDRSGDSLRAAFTKINANFTELYAALGIDADAIPNIGAFEFNGSTISTTDSTAITIDQATTVSSDLTVGGDIIPQTANGGDLGSATKPWRSLYVSNNTIFIGGTAVSINQSGELTVNGSSVSGGGDNPFDQDVNTTDSPNFVNIGLAGIVPPGEATPYATMAIAENSDLYISLSATETGSQVFEFGSDGRLLVPGALFVDGNVYGGAGDRLYLAGDIGESVPAIEIPNSEQGATTALSINNSQGGGVEIVTSSGTLTLDDNGDFFVGSSSIVGTSNSLSIFPQVVNSGNGRHLYISGGTTNPGGGTPGDAYLRGGYSISDTDGGNVYVTGGGTEGTGSGGRFGGDVYIRGGTHALVAYPNNFGDVKIGDDETQFVRIGSTANGTITEIDGYTRFLPGSELNLQNIAVTGFSNIGSEGNIDISVNLSDSTKYTWRFGEDGELTFPDGTSQTTAFIGIVDLKVVLGTGASAPGIYGISIGHNAGGNGGGGDYTVAIGHQAGQTNQGGGETNTAVAIGMMAGSSYQGAKSVAIGRQCGYDTQGENAVAIGDAAGNENQGLRSIAIGTGTGQLNQGTYAIAIGTGAGGSNQGEYAIAIGNNAGTVSQHTNTIILNAYSSPLQSDGTDRLYINPIRNTTGADGVLQYNNTNKEVSYSKNLTLDILTIEDGVHEKFAPIADATGVVAHDYSSGHIFYHTSPDANWTINLTNLNLASGYATTVTIIIEQGETGFYPSALQIGGAAQTINWQGNTPPTPSTSRTDVVTFSIFNNSGTYTVLGQLAGF